MDLSVAHDNAAAIALYEKLGFARVPVMAVKRKNAINEPLFTHPPETVDDLNPYARIIADEAMRRGIWVEVLDAEAGEMRLSHGGRSVVTRESLSEFTSAVAMSRCDDKRLTRRLVAEAGIAVPQGPAGHLRRRATTRSSPRWATSWSSRPAASRARASRSASTIRTELDAALARAREQHPDVLIEQRAPGDDLRLVVIDRQGGGRRAAAARGGHRHRAPHRARADRGPEPAPRGGDRR